MESETRIEQIIGITAIALLVVGCFVVLRPFISAVMWAAILCFSTWPIYSWLERLLKGRRNLAALLMTLTISMMVVVPMTFLGVTAADNLADVLARVKDLFRDGPPDPPSWVGSIPWVGGAVETYWWGFAHNGEKFLDLFKQIMVRWNSWFVARTFDFGQGIFQLCLSVFIAFFFYRDGMIVVKKVQDAVTRIVGDRTQHLLGVVGGTVNGVVYGILGTALAQGILAGIGFWVAGVPLPFLLGLLTFFLSLIPMGPPLIWISAAIWLFYKVSTFWGVSMILWGLLVVSGVDNVLKPYLISRGSNLPFVLVFLGVFGGIIAFGFIGIFLGPTLLAVGYTLLQEWSAHKEGEHA